MAIGYFIRRTLAETPAFLEEKQHDEVPKLPLAVLFGHYTTDVVRVVFCARDAPSQTQPPAAPIAVHELTTINWRPLKFRSLAVFKNRSLG